MTQLGILSHPQAQMIQLGILSDGTGVEGGGGSRSNNQKLETFVKKRIITQ